MNKYIGCTRTSEGGIVVKSLIGPNDLKRANTQSQFNEQGQVFYNKDDDKQ